MATISVHNGTMVSRAHNLRLPGIVEKQPHIDPNGLCEVWHDESEITAYRRLFQDAVDDYNFRQTRDDRIIRNFHTKIAKSGQQSTAYELIVGVYGADCSPKVGYQILREFYTDWKRRNPKLELIGAYYHADEDGDPHIHLDYVPVAEGYTKGVRKQPGMRRALEQMGYGKSGKDTAQISWERAEQAYLEQLCTEQGLTVEHPGGRKKHLSVVEYKAEQEEARLQTIVDGELDLHERKALGNSRVTVDADGLQILREQSRAYRIMISEPSLRTRSAIAAQRQKELLKIESDLYERERRLEEAQRVLTQQRDEWEKEKEVQQTAISIMTSLLATISKALRELLDRFPLPKPCRNVLSRLAEKIDAALGVDTTSRADRDYDTHR